MKLFTVDVFTHKPFQGNPAGVCILDNAISKQLCLLIAREINYSETAFVLKQSNNSYRISWFTPKTEVDLCGHATLAAAKILYEKYPLDSTLPITFQSKKGKLTAKKYGEKIELNFPQLFTQPVASHKIIEKGFGFTPKYIGRDSIRYLIEIDNNVQIEAIQPDFQILAQDSLGRFTITAKTDNKRFDFKSRHFAPKVGVLEDPVTGSSHCYLAPYWAKKLNKNCLVGFQASERGGVVECELIENERVLLRGESVIMHELKLLYR